MPRISLCLIARNEEKMLPGCLDSVKGVVDDIVLVDTGSTDGTREIAAAAGARVFDLPWNDDFSAPRNEAIRHARGDWLLQLDADERLAPGGGRKLHEFARRPEFHLGLLPLHNATALDAPAADVISGRARRGNVCCLARFIRNRDEPVYSGIVHESVEAWIRGRNLRAGYVDAPIVHYGAIESVRTERGKTDRNLVLLRRRCADAPDDVFALGYLAGELYDRGDYDGASAAVEQGWATLDRQPRSCSFLRLALQRARLALRRGDAEGALAAIEVTEQRDGKSYDAAIMRALACELLAYGDTGGHRVEHARRAGEAWARAITLYEVPSALKLNGATLSDLHIGRGHALLVTGELDGADEQFSATLALDATSRLARLGRAEVHLERQDPVQALTTLEPLLTEGSRHPDAWMLAADAARRLGAAADADLFLDRARQLVPNGFAGLHRLARWCQFASNAPPSVRPAPPAIAEGNAA